MVEFLKHLFTSDLMPHGRCWNWEPWVVWTNVIPDAVLAVAYLAIAANLFYLVAKRQDGVFDRLVVFFGIFIFACGCTYAMEVYNTWHGAFRLAGAVKILAAAVSCFTLAFLIRINPNLLEVPSLDRALALDAALTCEQREKRQMEGQLKESQDRFRLLVDGILDYAIFMMDPQGIVSSWNPGAERITGYTQNEVIGQPFSRLFPQEEAAAGRPEAILREAAEKGRIEEEGWKVRKDGSRFVANAIITAFRDSRGVLQGFSKVARDVTANRTAQKALEDLAESLEDQVQAQLRELRASEARLQGFVRHSPAAIAFKGLDGRFLHVNPRMEAVLGRPASEIIGRTIQEVLPPAMAAQYRGMEEELHQSGKDLLAEDRFTDAKGQTRHYLTNLFPLVDTTGQCWGLGIISTDVTDHKRADLAVLQSQKLESLGVLAGGIAHDFNNLLGAMVGNVELALEQSSLECARSFLDTLLGLMSKASDLLRQMLAYAGQGKAAVTTLDLNRMVGEMAQLLATSISKKALLHRDLHPGQLLLEADSSQIQQVIMNLVINASEAIGDQSGTITIRTRPEDVGADAFEAAQEGGFLPPGPYVSLEVTDDGSGMPQEVLKKIFDPFFTTKFAGRGLGLAAIQGIVRSHHGGIRVASEPGRGSTFKIMFPAAKGPFPVPVPDPPPPEPNSGMRPFQGKVLVVDDEEAMRAVAVKALERASIPTLQARDGRDALQVYREHQAQIRLILMDLTMPNLDGEETCRELRRQGATVPVILSSGFNEADVLRRFEGIGLAGFVQKPFALKKLVELVRKVLAG